MLLRPGDLDLLPQVEHVLSRLTDDPRAKAEMPASQLELLALPHSTVGAAASELTSVRARAAAAAEGIGVLAACGVHPFAAPEGALTADDRSDAMLEEYGRIARRQLVSGLHVHVAVGPADRAIAVYNVLREYLPPLAALAANSPFYDGADTGLASVRPKIAELLPRQGIPPPLASVEDYSEALTWAARSGALRHPRQWWWELRPHPLLGTIEVRVFDAQPTVRQAAALGSVVQALCDRLARRHDGGDLPPPAPTWRIEENRWSACRHGVRGAMADVRTRARCHTAELIAALIDDLVPTAAELGCHEELAAAGQLLQLPPAEQHRDIAAARGLRGLVDWLVTRFSCGRAG